MIIALSLIILGLLALLVIAHQLENAPEGFEDERGFHRLVSQGSIASSHTGPAPMANAGEAVG